jgi:hypothetical protein
LSHGHDGLAGDPDPAADADDAVAMRPSDTATTVAASAATLRVRRPPANMPVLPLLSAMWGADYLSRLVSVKCQLKKGDTRATDPVFGHEAADFDVSGNRLLDPLATLWCSSISAARSGRASRCRSDRLTGDWLSARPVMLRIKPLGPVRQRPIGCDSHSQLSRLNMSLPFAVVSGIGWRTSQCSTILPSSLSRKMSTAAVFQAL